MDNRSYSAEIIAVGTELLLGNTTNTDARDISEMLSELGINVYYHTVVGDNPMRLRSVVDIARSRSDIIITTGGLGPTYDDLTKQVLAESFGLPLYFDDTQAERIRGFFRNRPGAVMTDNNLQQAFLPEGCTVFQNDWGTAPGCAFEAKGKHVLMLPGPPRECNAMFRECAVPYLRALSDWGIYSHNIRIFGEGESAVEAKLRDRMNEMTNPTLAPYAKEGEVMLRVTARAESRQSAEELMAPVMREVSEILGDVIYGVDVESLEERVSVLLREGLLTLSCAESCTGGLLSKRMTDLPGASDVFVGGLICYSDASKTSLLGIPEELIREYGVVSHEVAAQMARRVRELLDTDFGIGITGIAGPGTDGVHNVGEVFIALATPVLCFVRKIQAGTTRDRVRTAAANNALDMLRRFLTQVDIKAAAD